MIRSLRWIHETRQLHVKWRILSYQNAFKMCDAKSLDFWRLGPGLARSSRWRMNFIKRISPWEQTFWSFLNFDMAWLKIEEIRTYRINKLVSLYYSTQLWPKDTHYTKQNNPGRFCLISMLGKCSSFHLVKSSQTRIVLVFPTLLYERMTRERVCKTITVAFPLVYAWSIFMSLTGTFSLTIISIIYILVTRSSVKRTQMKRYTWNA